MTKVPLTSRRVWLNSMAYHAFLVVWEVLAAAYCWSFWTVAA